MQDPSADSAPPVVTPPPGNPRFPHFDGLRAIAALSVVLLHTVVFTDHGSGWTTAIDRQLAAGVTVFFVISGFLLYRPFVAARLGRGRPIRLRDYSRRRLLRIVPAYWFCLTVLALWPGLPGKVFSGDWWVYYGFGQNFSERTLTGGLATAWSLGTEVTFYLLLPLYALVARRLVASRSMRRALGYELAMLAFLSLASLAFRATTAGSHPNLSYTLLGTFDWFAIGMALAVISVVSEVSDVRPRPIAFLERFPSLCWGASVTMLLLAAAYWDRTGDTNASSGGPLHLLWGLIALFLVLPAAFGGRGNGAPRRVLTARFVAWLGLVSYGIYLWHLPLVNAFGPALERTSIGASGLAATSVLFAIVVTVTVACAAFSYYVVERPLLEFKDRRRTALSDRKVPGAAAARSSS